MEAWPLRHKKERSNGHVQVCGEPTGAQYKHYFVQCQRCGVPVGVIEFRNSAKLIEEIQAKLLRGQKALHADIQDIQTRVRNLERSR